MSADSLPYTVLILLAELAIGSLAVLTVFDAKGGVTHGYVKAGAITIVPLAGLAAWTMLVLSPGDAIEGYRLVPGWLDGFRLLFGAFTALAVAHFVASMLTRRGARLALGAAGSAVGAAALVALAGALAAPAWSYAGMVASLLVGAAVLGGALMAMMWGHWYLTEGRLPKEPLEQMSLVFLGALVVQAVLVVIALLAPVREAPVIEGFGASLAQNPALWLRIVVGLAFPVLLAWLAWRAATIRGMMSATGLLYIALGAVLAGEVLARGLLFTTGAAV